MNFPLNTLFLFLVISITASSEVHKTAFRILPSNKEYSYSYDTNITETPTSSPTDAPTDVTTPSPTLSSSPTLAPTKSPTVAPTATPTEDAAAFKLTGTTALGVLAFLGFGGLLCYCARRPSVPSKPDNRESEMSVFKRMAETSGNAYPVVQNNERRTTQGKIEGFGGGGMV